MPFWSVPVAAAVVVIGILAWLSIKVIPQYERGVVFRLGKLRPVYRLIEVITECISRINCPR